MIHLDSTHDLIQFLSKIAVGSIHQMLKLVPVYTENNINYEMMPKMSMSKVKGDTYRIFRISIHLNQ